MKIALVSLNQVWEDKKVNLDLCEKYIQKASGEDADLIVFPEMTLTGFSMNIGLTAEDFENSQTIQSFSLLAKQFNIGIIFGVVVKDESKALNKSIFVDIHGKVLGDYSKTHPFSFTSEEKFFNAGNKLLVVNFKDVNFGLTICYDLRFPELYSALGKQADVIINIANWPAKRVDHWDILLKARAIENQIFVVGANRTGKDENGLKHIESSNVFNANGERLEFDEYEDMKIYEINTNWTEEFKTKFNTTNDRKIDFYKEIL
jgi:omega-amidase